MGLATVQDILQPDAGQQLGYILDAEQSPLTQACTPRALGSISFSKRGVADDNDNEPRSTSKNAAPFPEREIVTFILSDCVAFPTFLGVMAISSIQPFLLKNDSASIFCSTYLHALPKHIGETFHAKIEEPLVAYYYCRSESAP